MMFCADYAQLLKTLSIASLTDCSDDVWASVDLSNLVDNIYEGLLCSEGKLISGTELMCIMLSDKPQSVIFTVPESVQCLKLVVPTSPYDAAQAGFNPVDDNSWMVTMNDIELICSSVECAQDMIRFLRGVQNMYKKYDRILSYALSDFFGMYVDTGRTFYQNVGTMDGMLMDPSWGASTAFEQEKKTRWFRLSEHGILIKGKRINEDRYGIAGEDRSWGAYAIDIGDIHAYFYFEPPADSTDFPGVSIFTADLLSYYFPDIVKALSDKVDIAQLPGYALVCRVKEVDGNLYAGSSDANITNEQNQHYIAFTSGLTEPLLNYTIEIRVTSDLYSMFSPGSNRGERLVVRTFLSALCHDVVTYLGANLDVYAILDVVVPESITRKFIVSTIEQNADNIRLGHHKSLSIHPYDESRLLDELAEIVGTSGMADQHPPLQSVEKLLKEAVNHFFTKLVADIRSIAGAGFACFVYNQLESTLFERIHQTWEIVAAEETFDGVDPVKQMEDHLRNIGEKLSAQRFLLEMVACYQSGADPPFSIERYLEMLALCHVITDLGSIVDDIHFGLSIECVELLASKRFEFNRKDKGRPFDLLQQVRAVQSYNNAQSSFIRLSKPDTDENGADVRNESFQEIDKAFISEYGYSAQQLLDSFTELAKYSIEQSQTITILPWSQVVAVIEEKTNIPVEICKIIVEHRSLHKRDDLDAGMKWSEVQPWRSYREWSLINKPLIRISIDGIDNLLFGPKALLLAIRHLLDRASAGLLRGTTKSFKQIMSQLANQTGSKLENDTASRIEIFGWSTRTRIKRQIKGNDGESFWGEVDVLAWNAEKRRLIVMECKDLQRALNPYAFAQELQRFYELNSDDSFVPKLKRKVSWFKENLPSVLLQLGVQPIKVSKWHVKGMIITDDAHYSAYIGKSECQIIPLDQLNEKDMLR